jgi:hypothetical protein
MSKDNLIKICKGVYNYLIKKGLNSTLVKVLVAAAFGVAAAYLLTACSVSYKNEGVEYKGSILTPV